MAGVAARRAEAFRSQVQPEIEVLLRVAGRLTGSWAEADDLVQETLIRAWRAVDRFDGRHPRAWLLTILRHTHANMHRRSRPDLVGEPDALEGQRPAFGGDRRPGPEEEIVDRTLSAEVEQALATLDRRIRVVLLLVDADGLSYAEAAEVLGVPVGTVTSRLSRARDRMRRQLRSHVSEGGGSR